MITAGLHHTACNGSETLLTSCVPDLKLDPFIVQHNLLDLEVNPGQDIKYSNGAAAITLSCIADQGSTEILVRQNSSVRTQWW